MKQNYDLITGEFQHIFLEGSPYEIGELQGEILEKNKKRRLCIEKTITTYLNQLGLVSGELNAKRLGFQDFNEMEAFFEKFCPDLNEEMEGFADNLGLKKHEMPFYYATYQTPNNICKQFGDVNHEYTQDI